MTLSFSTFKAERAEVQDWGPFFDLMSAGAALVGD